MASNEYAMPVALGATVSTFQVFMPRGSLLHSSTKPSRNTENSNNSSQKCATSAKLSYFNRSRDPSAQTIKTMLNRPYLRAIRVSQFDWPLLSPHNNLPRNHPASLRKVYVSLPTLRIPQALLPAAFEDACRRMGNMQSSPPPKY